MKPELRNTTPIPDILFWIAYAHALPAGVQISSITTRYKKQGLAHGRWGSYYTGDSSIILNIPRKFNTSALGKAIGDTRFRKPYTRQWIEVSSHTEYLVATLAHELRHGYQHQIVYKGTRDFAQIYDTPLGCAQLEVDAEMYELERLATWKRNHQNVQAIAASCI